MTVLVALSLPITLFSFSYSLLSSLIREMRSANMSRSNFGSPFVSWFPLFPSMLLTLGISYILYARSFVTSSISLRRKRVSILSFSLALSSLLRSSFTSPNNFIILFLASSAAVSNPLDVFNNPSNTFD